MVIKGSTEGGMQGGERNSLALCVLYNFMLPLLPSFIFSIENID